MTSDCRLATILAHAVLSRMKQRELLQHRFIFQQPISIQSLENQRALITRELKIRHAQPLKRPLQQLKNLIMP